MRCRLGRSGERPRFRCQCLMNALTGQVPQCPVIRLVGSWQPTAGQINSEDDFRVADNPSGVSCLLLTDVDERYICRIRTEHFTLSLSSKYADGPQQARTGIHQRDSREVTIPVGAKHVDSDGSGICFLVISDTASFSGVSLQARAHDRTIRGWWWA
jgi:hypothetical protein